MNTTMTYTPSCGEHINTACREATRIARKNGLPVTFEFNGVKLTATPDRAAADIVADYNRETERRAEEYRNSEEGRLAAARREKQIYELGAKADWLLGEVDKVLAMKRLNKVMDWLKEFVPVADDISVTFDKKALAAKFEEAGFMENEGVGQKPEWFSTRERMGRYIVGQVISMLKAGMPPHPMTVRFVDKYKALSETGRTKIVLDHA